VRRSLIGSVACAGAHEVGAGAPPVSPNGPPLRGGAFSSLLDYFFRSKVDFSLCKSDM
jgi:hypothetical protein